MLSHSRIIIVVALSALLSACPAPRRPSLPPAGQSPVLQPVPGAQALNIMPEASLVRIIVYRGGALAQMGHNHVIASHDLRGKVYLHSQLERSAFEVVMPVQSLVIDDATLRNQEGEGFPPEVPESAKQGTRKNMLSDALLDGDRYPNIRLICTSLQGTEQKLTARVRVNIKDQWKELTVPIRLEWQRNQVRAAGEFKVTHAALGLEPFSAALGALKVQDELLVRFEFAAQ